ncbi:MAG: hypothetical protein M1837_005839 [Sclerophora amabilis]|nr:MAG: hypothetical protein M1837_005839 [Sclerophora amabilis]
MCLTQALRKCDLSAFEQATRSQFLVRAGCGAVSKSVLSDWLAQDKLYAQSYISFIGGLLAKIRFPSAGNALLPTRTVWRTVDILIAALQNVRRELHFFEDVAREYGLSLDEGGDGQGGEATNIRAAKPVTRAYQDLFAAVAGPSASLLEGLVLLWGTEHCYNQAWIFAEGHGPLSEDEKMDKDFTQDIDGGALRQKLIPNWTNDEFNEFVTDLEDLVNDAAANATEEEKTRCKEVWKQVLWLEKQFWPEM